MATTCSRCPYPARDYCARCGDVYCEHCMAAGCCGASPAESGVEVYYEENAQAVRGAVYSDSGISRLDLVATQ